MRFSAGDLTTPMVRALGFLLAATISAAPTSSLAGDLPTADGEVFAAPMAAAPSDWQFRITPYVWIPGVSGDVTVRGNPVDIDVNVFDLFDSGSSGVDLDSLAALMGYLEVSTGNSAYRRQATPTMAGYSISTIT